LYIACIIYIYNTTDKQVNAVCATRALRYAVGNQAISAPSLKTKTERHAKCCLSWPQFCYAIPFYNARFHTTTIVN